MVPSFKYKNTQIKNFLHAFIIKSNKDVADIENRS